ncbi:unnamed protein product [Pocillopora meandrina]|uniref:Uncharacterized protein n=1 Tax=Pocillopora meandrina TaxID=46732 RepID=A0AAU9X766_9CNID|nr:unnamed protein product [Pocillopora meandrina]
MQIWDWLRSLQMKSIDVEHHMVPKHSQTSILKPQYSCQQPRPRTPDTFLCYKNRYLHHTFDYFASKHTVSIPPCYDYSSVVTLVHDAIHKQPLARHAKIKEQFEKMESEVKIC